MTASAAPAMAGVAALVLALVAGLVTLQTAGSSAAETRVPTSQKVLGAQPILSYRGFADPTVVRYAGGYVGVSTGPAAPRAVAPQPGGPWTNIPSALLTLPSWAVSGRIWASDLVQIGTTWVLYFSAEVAGLGLDGRCIGTATAPDPTLPFTPDERPLVCPKQAVSPKAYDRLKRRGRDMPKAGVIDPEQYQDRSGTRYLLYRTQSTPSSIRIVQLPANGRAFGGERSKELVRVSDIIENPTVYRKGKQYVLLTSESYFGDCTYETTYRRSKNLMDFSTAKRKVLLNSDKTGLCGPGGADLGTGPNGEPLLFFHAWTCPAIGNCPPGVNYDRSVAYDARRSLFAGVLRFTRRKAPRISSWVAPIAPPPVCATVTPTATVTVTGFPTSTPSPPGALPTAECTVTAPPVTTTATVAPTTSTPLVRPTP